MFKKILVPFCQYFLGSERSHIWGIRVTYSLTPHQPTLARCSSSLQFTYHLTTLLSTIDRSCSSCPHLSSQSPPFQLLHPLVVSTHSCIFSYILSHFLLFIPFPSFPYSIIAFPPFLSFPFFSLFYSPFHSSPVYPLSIHSSPFLLLINANAWQNEQQIQHQHH